MLRFFLKNPEAILAKKINLFSSNPLPQIIDGRSLTYPIRQMKLCNATILKQNYWLKNKHVCIWFQTISEHSEENVNFFVNVNLIENN